MWCNKDGRLILHCQACKRTLQAICKAALRARFLGRSHGVVVMCSAADRQMQAAEFGCILQSGRHLRHSVLPAVQSRRSCSACISGWQTRNGRCPQQITSKVTHSTSLRAMHTSDFCLHSHRRDLLSSSRRCPALGVLLSCATYTSGCTYTKETATAHSSTISTMCQTLQAPGTVCGCQTRSQQRAAARSHRMVPSAAKRQRRPRAAERQGDAGMRGGIPLRAPGPHP